MEKISKGDIQKHIAYCSSEFARILNTHKLPKKEKEARQAGYDDGMRSVFKYKDYINDDIC
jgi:hypothetical protein